MLNCRVAMAALAASAMILTSGCGVIYSQQNYGSPLRGHTISEGASRADVIANMGLPNGVYRNGDTEAFVYKGITGRNYLGLYSSIKRNDTVVVMDGRGIVLTAAKVDAGAGSTWLSFPATDATHPVRTKELLFDPSNYEYEANNDVK